MEAHRQPFWEALQFKRICFRVVFAVYRTSDLKIVCQVALGVSEGGGLWGGGNPPRTSDATQRKSILLLIAWLNKLM